MILKHAHSISRRVAILLAAGFEEGETIYCLGRLRRAGISTSLVGTVTGLISGANGVTLRPDCILEELTLVSPPEVILIPDGKKSVAVLLADPRVHRLLAAAVENGGRIAAMPTAVSMLDGLAFGKSDTVSPIITPADDSLDAFADQLIDLILR